MINVIIYQFSSNKICFKEIQIQKSKLIRKYNDENLETLNLKLQSIDWFSIIDNCNDSNLIFEAIKSKYLDILNEVIPEIETQQKRKKSYNKSIRTLINQRRYILRNQIFIKNFREKYFYLTQNIGNEIIQFKNSKMKTIFDNSNKYYYLYKYMRKQMSKPIDKSFIDKTGKRITDPCIIANNFKDVFQSKSRINKQNDNFLNDKLNGVQLDNFSMNDILLALNKLNLSKAQGNTFIDNIVIKNCLNGTTKLFYHLFNKIIEIEKIPDEMKISYITPVAKPDKKRNLFESHRSISVHSNIYKLLEIIISNKLNPYLSCNSIIPNNQYSYKPNIGINNIHTDI